jgi:hypothetical protein
MSGVSVEWEGVPELVALMRELVDRNATVALAAGLQQEAETIMTKSKRDYVPVDTGTLRASGHVKEPVITGTRVQVTMGYGGAASAYAIVQHENTQLHHPNGGQAKYLEQPVMEAIRGFDRRVGAIVAAKLAAM